MSGFASDLVVLVPDVDIEATIKALLSLRTRSLGIRPVNFEIHIHPYRDPGCYHESHDYLRPFIKKHAHALVLFDRQGCGQEAHDRSYLENEVTRRLSMSGWGDRAEAVVLDPEIEVWVWSGSPHVERCLGWEGKAPDLRSWLQEKGLLEQASQKPSDPKKAVERALRKVKTPRSSSLYEELARRVSWKHCKDPALEKFITILQSWFPVE